MATSYGNIFKTTFLFGFVQIFNIIIKVVQNKIVAFLLGPLGMGFIGLYRNSLDLLNTGCGLGINKSAVKDISESKSQEDEERTSYIISLVRRVILYTGLLGLIMTISLSHFLSLWSFGNTEHTISYICLSVAVICTIISTGQSAILTGMRQLQAMAKSSMIGSGVGLITSVPLYWLFGESGIVPSLIVSALSALVVTRIFVDKIKYKHFKITWHDINEEARSMVKMGIALMLVSLFGFLFSMIVAIMIRYYDSVTLVGIYTAGVTIISGYFGIVITAMTTDYYPRICAVNKDNALLQEEVNRQSEVGLILVFPLAIIFTLFSKLFISILYSTEFYDAILYTDYAILGMIIVVCSNCMGMVVLAKQKANIFLYSVLFQRTIILVIYYILFNKFGLIGLGVGYFCLGIIAMLVEMSVGRIFFSIKFTKRVFILLAIILTLIIIAKYIREMDFGILQIGLEVIMVLGSSTITLLYIRKKMRIDIIKIINGKFSSLRKRN